MKIQPLLIESIREAVTRVAGSEPFRIVDNMLFDGPSPYAVEPALLLTIAAEPNGISRGALHAAAWAAFPDLKPESFGNPDGPADAYALAECAAQLAGKVHSRGIRYKRAAGAIPGDDGQAMIWMEYVTGQPAIQALKVALIAVGAAATGAKAAVPDGQIARLEQLCIAEGPNSQSKILMIAAKARGIPYLQIAGNRNLWQFGWGSRSLAFWETSSNGDGLLSWHLSRRKEVAKRLFCELGLPTPRWHIVGPNQDPMRAIATTGWPCAVKPIDTGSGKGVSAKVETEADLRRAVEVARGFSMNVLVETHVPGEDFRLLVVDGRLAAAVRRLPPVIIGDGTSTVRDLLGRLNEGRYEEDGDGGHLTPVKEDPALFATLDQQGLTLDSVVEPDRKVLLRTNANRSTGGTVEDVLSIVHPGVRRMTEELAAAFGFRVTGVDYITADITRSPSEVGGSYIELNATSGLTVHLASGMTEAEIGGIVLGDKPGRIPVELMIVPEERHESFAAAIAKQMRGKNNIGATGPGWTRIGSELLPAIGLTPADTVRSLLRRPTIDRLVILWSDEQLTRFGLPVDRLTATLVAGVKLPKEWLAVVKKSSEHFTAPRSVDEALAWISRPRQKA